MDEELIRRARVELSKGIPGWPNELIKALASRLEERGREGAWRPTREEIAALVEQAMSAGALCYDSGFNPARWQAAVRTYTDTILALNPPAPPEGDAT